MLCAACHVHVHREFPYCLSCGVPHRRAKVTASTAPLLRWAGGEVALTGRVSTVGRSADRDVTIDDDSVSRDHGRIVRTTDGFLVEDTGSFNGTTVDGRDAPAILRDGSRIAFGDVEVTFTQPRSAAVGSKTQLRGTEHTMLRIGHAAPEVPAAAEPLAAVPRARSGWALKRLAGTGDPTWVLKNTRTGTYLSLDEQEVFIWERLDGRNSIRDLLFAYLERFGELALPRIEDAVRTFADAGLVDGLPGRQAALSGWRRVGAFVVQNLIRVQLSIKGLDPLVGRAYQAFAWRFFTPTAVLALWALIVGGIYAFAESSHHQQLFDLAGAGPVGGATVLAGYLVATALHESAHAFAVKSYGRRVDRGGFMLMMGMPFAFVDTSDMWFGTPYSRIVVALSGPLTTAGIAGAASIAATTVPDPRIAGVCYTLAFGLFTNTVYNLVPLLPLDGYQALADALRTPRLREEARAYFGQGLWRDITTRTRPGPKQIGLAVFAAASAICLYAGLGLAIVAWNSRLGQFFAALVPQPWLTVAVTAGLALLLFPVWYPRVRALAARRRDRRAATPPDEGPIEPTLDPSLPPGGRRHEA
ncbi:PqqD family peptide modification chaperone [Pseudonocardia sp. GCM10023141]|uniref:PqqD family peptide modification chaperone n=1 Tax=Pseudonocardia sp. GCM10023141 TaxID=3252653 RepID=UPI00361D5FF6